MTSTTASPGTHVSVSARGANIADWLVLMAAAVGLAAVLVGAARGALGRLATCGADGAMVCIAWSGVASVITWLGFVGVIVLLVGVQARDWRGVTLSRDVTVSRRELAVLLVVLVAALAERAWRSDLTNVAYDEASAASLIAAWRLDGLFPLTGIVSSVGIPNPPGWPYLLALALLWFDSPYGVLGLGIAASLLATVLTWWVARRWIGAWAAPAAALFYAGGFWAAFLGRGGWQPVFLQLPVILCVDALLVLAIRRAPWALIVACGWLGLMVQLHYIALVFAVMLPVAAWPARHALRPVHLVSGALVAAALLTRFLIYELNPAVRLRDFTLLGDSAAGTGAHWDLEAWNLTWTLVGNGGIAGLGGPDTEGLREALGRWSNLGLIGIPLAACGLLAATAGRPRGWRGALIVGWALTPAVGLSYHTLGLIFHYLYLALPGMALAVGALAEWVLSVRPRLVRPLFGGALAIFVAVSAASLWVVLDHVQQTGVYPGSARPLGLNYAAAETARSLLPPGYRVLIGGPIWEVEILRFAVGHDLRPEVFDDCGQVPSEADTLYLLNSERRPGAAALEASEAPLLARVPRPGDAFLIYGPSHAGPVPLPSSAGGC